MATFFINALTHTIAAVVYARFVLTSDQNMAFMHKHGSSAGILNGVRTVGPIRLWDLRVWALAALIVLPAWTYPVLAGGAVHNFLIWLSFGAILSPLTLPTLLDLSRDDLRSDDALTLIPTKWIAGKIDVWIKTLAFTVALTLLSYLPIIGKLGAHLVSIMIPVVANQEATTFFNKLVEGALGLAVIMILLRLINSYVHGVLYASFSAVAFSYMWVSSQYYVNVIFVGLGANPDAARVSLLSVFLSGVILDAFKLLSPSIDERLALVLAAQQPISPYAPMPKTVQVSDAPQNEQDFPPQ